MSTFGITHFLMILLQKTDSHTWGLTTYSRAYYKESHFIDLKRNPTHRIVDLLLATMYYWTLDFLSYRTNQLKPSMDNTKSWRVRGHAFFFTPPLFCSHLIWLQLNRPMDMRHCWAEMGMAACKGVWGDHTLSTPLSVFQTRKARSHCEVI